LKKLWKKQRKNLDEIIIKTGKDALAELGIPNVHKDMIPFIGRLKYPHELRTKCT